MILHEMILNLIRKNNLRLKNVNPQFLVIHPDRLRKILSEDDYLTLLAQKEEPGLLQAATTARAERKQTESERAEILKTQREEQRKEALARIRLENEEQEEKIRLENEEIELRKKKLKESKLAATDAASLAVELATKARKAVASDEPGTDASAPKKAAKKTTAKKAAKKTTAKKAAKKAGKKKGK